GDLIRILDVELEVWSIISRRLRTSIIRPRKGCCAKDIRVAEVKCRLGNKQKRGQCTEESDDVSKNRTKRRPMTCRTT
ncbi:unnamed protein product, partial [Musa textilis]